MGNCFTVQKSLPAKKHRMSPLSSTPAIGSTTTASNTQIVDHLAQSTIMTNREFHQVDSSYWLPMDENERQRLTGVNEEWM